MLAKTPFAFVDKLTPALFVVLWSTGWIVARYSAEYADPLTFLSVRYAVAAAVLLALALAVKAPWPRSRRALLAVFASGVLIHALYLGGVWWAIRHGVPASISALLAALQPIFTVVLAPSLLGERLTRRQGVGVAVGFCGLVLVLWPQLAGVEPGRIAAVLLPIGVNVVAMVSVTLGSIFQKRAVEPGDLRVTAGLQYVAALIVTLPVAALIEPLRITWNATMLATLAWSVFALSIGAVVLYLMLIRRGAVSRSAQLIYLVPPTAALQAFALFGERLAPIQLVGMAVTVVGVMLASATGQAARAEVASAP